MSDPERKAAPDVKVRTSHIDERLELLQRWNKAYPDRVHCFQDSLDPLLATRMKRKQMSKVTTAECKVKTAEGNEEILSKADWRGDLVCWRDKDVYVKHRTRMYDEANEVAELFADPLGDYDDTHRIASPKKPKASKRRRPGEAINND